jgi:lycopene beta-cyclase
VLPMGLARKPPSLGAGHVVVGVMAGGARASSGFAFQRIQQWADQCCAAIASGGLPVGHRDDPLLVRMMDRLFLQVLLAAPHAAPHLFLSLFERADRACVIRFLSGTSTVWDCLRVIKSLPAKPFVRQLFSGAPAAVPSRARS